MMIQLLFLLLAPQQQTVQNFERQQRQIEQIQQQLQQQQLQLGRLLLNSTLWEEPSPCCSSNSCNWDACCKCLSGLPVQRKSAGSMVANRKLFLQTAPPWFG